MNFSLLLRSSSLVWLVWNLMILTTNGQDGYFRYGRMLNKVQNIKRQVASSGAPDNVAASSADVDQASPITSLASGSATVPLDVSTSANKVAVGVRSSTGGSPTSAAAADAASNTVPTGSPPSGSTAAGSTASAAVISGLAQLSSSGDGRGRLFFGTPAFVIANNLLEHAPAPDVPNLPGVPLLRVGTPQAAADVPNDDLPAGFWPNTTPPDDLLLFSLLFAIRSLAQDPNARQQATARGNVNILINGAVFTIGFQISASIHPSTSWSAIVQFLGANAITDGVRLAIAQYQATRLTQGRNALAMAPGTGLPAQPVLMLLDYRVVSIDREITGRMDL